MTSSYFVVKSDKGMYYRGEGVNRWGKQFNQATIYRMKGQAENTVKELSWRGEKAEVVPIEIREL